MDDILNDLKKAKELLLNDELVAIPTETVYGLAASIQSDEGIKKIFDIKERPAYDPLIVHIARLSQAKEVVSEWPPLADFLARKFWPGPMTLILPRHPLLNPQITAGLDTVGIRMPRHPLTRHLIDYVDTPLAAPSANKFGRTSPTEAEHVRSEFENVFVLDGGPCEVGVESSVISLTEENKIKILRPGFVTRERLLFVLRRYPEAVEITEGDSTASPGNLENHYQPSKPLVIVDGDPDENTISRIQKSLDVEGAHYEKLELNKNPVEEAKRLYSSLHKLSRTKKSKFIVVKKNQEDQKGEWVPIWDRLNRAASLDLTKTNTN